MSSVDDEAFELLTKETIVDSVKYMIGSFEVEKALVEWKKKNKRPCNELQVYGKYFIINSILVLIKKKKNFNGILQLLTLK